MVKKIVFLVESIFNKRDHERYGIEVLEKNGFDVEVWDFTHFLHPNVVKAVKVNDPVNWRGLRSFGSRKESCGSILGLKRDSLIICFLGYRCDTYRIYRSISRAGLRYCVSVINVCPKIPCEQNMAAFFGRLKKATPRDLLNALFCRAPFDLLGIAPVTILIAGGEEVVNDSRYPVNEKTETLFLHTWDYDNYLKTRDVPSGINGHNGVFLDQSATLHEDSLYRKPLERVSPEEYYPFIRKFFDQAEKRFKNRIIIAAHPRSRYEDHPEYFGERAVIRGRTAELVRDSSFVIAHSSTSVNYAVLYKKPVIFLTTDKYHKVDGSNIDLLASLLGKKPINIDDPLNVDWDKELTVDEEAYIRHKNRYIKKAGTEDILSWQMFADYVKNI